MSAAPRGRSLFWTVSGLFLLAVAVGSLVQVLVAVAVLGPLEAREARSRAELAASTLSAEIAASPGHWTAAEMRALFERVRAALGPGPAVFGYRDGAGWRMTDPPERGRFLDRVQLGARPPAPEPERGPAGAGAAGPDARRWRAGPRPHPYREIVVRRDVRRGAEWIGEVVVVRPLMWPRLGTTFPGAPTPLLFLPITLILAAIVGLLVVRMLVRRLRAMEALAARVADGDLTVRIGDAGGDEIGRVAARLDWMTERLAEARARLEENERQRRQLFADITHELATPLTSIRGYAETLQDPAVPVTDEERARYLRGVVEESRRLDRLIRDLFELARLEAGASALALEPLDWAALCRNTAERFEPRFRDAGLVLRWTEAPAEAWVHGDGHRLEQVLENLLANALRYVPSGAVVEVSLARAPQADRHRLTVSDDGPGVPAAELAHVFERFYRAAGARASGGSGLGLAIVREIVERHGGAVSAETRAPHGLSISVELPARV